MFTNFENAAWKKVESRYKEREDVVYRGAMTPEIVGCGRRIFEYMYEYFTKTKNGGYQRDREGSVVLICNEHMKRRQLKRWWTDLGLFNWDEGESLTNEQRVQLYKDYMALKQAGKTTNAAASVLGYTARFLANLKYNAVRPSGCIRYAELEAWVKIYKAGGAKMIDRCGLSDNEKKQLGAGFRSLVDSGVAIDVAAKRLGYTASTLHGWAVKYIWGGRSMGEQKIWEEKRAKRMEVEQTVSVGVRGVCDWVKSKDENERKMMERIVKLESEMRELRQRLELNVSRVEKLNQEWEPTRPSKK